MSFIVVYITAAGEQEAKNIAGRLLEKRLIACANIFPVQSTYHWQGALVEDAEFVALVKTRSEFWEIVKEEVLKTHSYQTPCIMKFEVEANPEYERWIYKETQIDGGL
ncbi:MAG: divalent-cation tolerance protein CutA [Sphingobacteriales bacterium]|nr:MAG: divalent-cation tolerance protein CutA [Sphingobacteriales bacterium]